MYYSAIKNCDIANGEGVRVSLFVSGCRNHCPGCFQPETWSFTHGQPFTEETETQLLSLLAPSYIAGLSVLGGEPFEPENQIALLPFLRRVRTQYPEKTIWCYTGFVYETLLREECRGHCEHTASILELLDVLVDGPFVETEYDISLRFRGSRNQRLIALGETRRTGTLCFLPDRRRITSGT